MQLQWSRYKSGDGHKYILAIHLGTSKGKECVLVSDKVPNSELKLIKESRNILDKLSLDQLLVWMKSTCPITMRLAYRTIPSDKYEIIQQYT